MEITSVNIKIVENEKPVRAYCSLIFDNAFIVRKIRIIEKGNSRFLVSMPSLKNKNGDYADVCHPTTPQMRRKIDVAILKHFDALLNSKIAGEAGESRQPDKG